ncbi:methyltransferase domain-containing protein [Inquilinus sp.]|jgi:SAM-dependent methyltransferase|uniref:methyltransferase domain-containing protein n=1 Tax=Inquilinus sp. TaxID=1932117 RepID=UPI0037832941
MMDADGVVAGLGLVGSAHAIQLAQTRFRMRLVDHWRIAPGARVLEIGCGQGDTTLALAAAVGPDGHVTAIDTADGSYGAPDTLTDAAERIGRSSLGGRIAFRFGADILDPAIPLPHDRYDCAVLAHCSWYFRSVEVLRRTLRRLGDRTDRLCLSEWDLQPTRPTQIPHLLAVILQGRMARLDPAFDGNVRTPLSQAALTAVLREAGWRVDEVAPVDSTRLQDGRWEVDNGLALLPQPLTAFETAPLAGIDMAALQAVIGSAEIESLPSFAMTCRRIG